MSAGRVAHCAASLAWLAPSAECLIALAGNSQSTLADDPASVLLLARFSRPTPEQAGISLDSNAFRQSAILEAAATFLESNAGAWPDARQPAVACILHACRSLADEAEMLASSSGACSPVAARVAALLAPLGWLALAAVDADGVRRCLENPDFPAHRLAVQENCFGMSADAVLRRLARHWRLPGWIADTITTLHLPLNDAVRIGADRALSQVVRASITVNEVAEFLGLGGMTEAVLPRPALLEEIMGQPRGDNAPPHAERLLPALLRRTAQAIRATGAGRIEQLERQVDVLQSALAGSRREFEDSLREAKLQALAEFAAGAGHEINNPLAVISGNAQLLKAREEDPDRLRSMEAIIRQTARIADLLHDLMQFARPPAAIPRLFHVGDLLAAAEREARPIAAMKQVTISVQSGTNEPIFADANQIRKALGNLVRNSIEAVDTGGAVHVAAHARQGRIEFIVEDTGPGPSPEQTAHLFDPFYSGRSAGRGRGLGLSTAWRLAALNEGEIRFERPPGGPTRFILALPVARAAEESARHSA